MKIKAAIVLILATAIPPITFAVEPNEGTPEWIVESFFIKKEFPNKERYYTGEMKVHYLDAPNVRSLEPEGVKCEYHLVFQDDNTRNYSVQYTYKDWCGDWYCFIVREQGVWKLQAVRSLATIGLTEMCVEELEKKKSRTAEEERQLRTMKLSLACDRDIKQHFQKHKEEFKAVAKSFGGNSCLDAVWGEGRISKKDNCKERDINEIVEKVGRLFVERVGRAEEGNIEFLIGGILDNTVGLLFVPEGNKPPAMSDEEYILVEKIEDGWYLYKTT